MNSSRDHEKRLTQFFRDNPQIRNALKSHRDTKDPSAASSGRDWDEWAEATSMQQVELLRAKAQKNALYATKKYRQLRMARYAGLSVAVALIVFFSVAPTGRAFANAALHNATSLVNHFFTMQSTPATDIVVDKGPAVATEQPLTGMDKAKKAARYVDEPLLFMQEQGLTVSDVSVSSTEVMDAVEIEYSTANGDSIRTSQDIMRDPQAGWGATFDTSGESPETHVLCNGEILYYAYTHEGFALGMAHWGGTSFTISSTTLKWEEMLKYVDALSPIK